MCRERERNRNAYDQGDYNSSFALHAVELKSMSFGFPSRSNIDWAVQPQNILLEVEILDLGSRGIVLSL